MTVISVDLAYKDFRDVGLVLLEASGSRIVAVPIAFESVDLVGRPDAARLASFLASLAKEVEASAIVIDGPQGWKAEDNGLEHCRRCEQELATPGKTGPPRATKPANYLAFTTFSIALFDELAQRSFPRLATTGSWPHHVAIESFPTAAWRSLGISPLPGKGNSTGEDLSTKLDELKTCFDLDVRGELNHDQLQATVAGLAALPLERQTTVGIAFAGVEPFVEEGTWREGYILIPARVG
jgi:hypothetical protein